MGMTSADLYVKNVALEDAPSLERLHLNLVELLNSYLLADLKNQPIGSSCVTHILPFCGYCKGQEQIGFNPTSWHLVTYNFYEVISCDW